MKDFNLLLNRTYYDFQKRFNLNKELIKINSACSILPSVELMFQIFGVAKKHIQILSRLDLDFSGIGTNFPNYNKDVENRSEITIPF